MLLETEEPLLLLPNNMFDEALLFRSPPSDNIDDSLRFDAGPTQGSVNLLARRRFFLLRFSAKFD